MLLEGGDAAQQLAAPSSPKISVHACAQHWATKHRHPEYTRTCLGKLWRFQRNPLRKVVNLNRPLGNHWQCGVPLAAALVSRRAQEEVP
jgi:hypothetical protein